MQPQVIAAWIAATVAVLSMATTAILQVVFRSREQKERRKHEIMQHRKEALLAALQVIDHVYANTAWSGRPPTNPHKWDITLARDAMNKMIIFCKNPDRAVRGFCKALGLHNPDTKAPATYGPGDLQEFRKIVCEELEVPQTNYDNKDETWILKLPGTDANAT